MVLRRNGEAYKFRAQIECVSGSSLYRERKGGDEGTNNIDEKNREGRAWEETDTNTNIFFASYMNMNMEPIEHNICIVFFVSVLLVSEHPIPPHTHWGRGNNGRNGRWMELGVHEAWKKPYAVDFIDIYVCLVLKMFG